MFFVLSGFVIYRPFVAHRVLGAPHPGIVAYVRRRVLRIVPAYWLALTILAIYPGLGGVFTEDWWVYYGLLQLYPIYDASECGRMVGGCGIAPAVTLGGELGFYLMIPAYAALIGALTRGRLRSRWLLTVLLLGALALVSVVFRVWSAVHVPPLPYVFYGVPGTFLWLALGLGMAAATVALEGREGASRPVRLIAAHPSACWLVGIAIYLTLAIVYPAPILALFKTGRLQLVLEFLGVGLSAALIVITAVFGEGTGGLPRRILANRVLSWLGVVSYGIYLYHVPFQVKLVDLDIPGLLPGAGPVTLPALSLVVATLCAAISYYAFERPILKLKDPRRARSSPAPLPGKA